MIRKTRILLILCCFLIVHGAFLNAEEKKTQARPDKNDNCILCHDQQSDGNLKKSVSEWRTSVHAIGGKQCNQCHGGDSGAIEKLKAKSKQANFVGKPNNKTISEFCGREGCHSTALEQFKRGPHYQSAQKTGEPACTSCHGVHNIQRSSLDVINAKSCTACHPAEYSKNIVALIGDIDRSISGIDKNINFLLEKHADVSSLQERLNNARHLFHQFVHVFSRQDMETTKKILEMEIKSLAGEARMKVLTVKRLDILYMAMIIFGMSIIVGITIYTIIMYSRRKK